jgi:beta-phosphoglucomutase-like phosphatase (HAD superfamily)
MSPRARGRTALHLTGNYNITPDEARAFEDSMTGIRSAQAVGLNVVCIPTLKAPDYPADTVFTSLDDNRLVAWLDKWSSKPML